MINILLTSSGGINGMNVIKALKRQKEIPVSIISTDADSVSASAFLSKKFYKTPKANNPSYIKSLIEICKKEKIDILMSMHSSDLFVLAREKEKLEEAGIKIAIPSIKTIEICWDKKKTIEFLKKENLPFPKTYTEKELNNKNIDFPLFIKQNSGSGSKHAHKIEDLAELEYHRSKIKNYIIQEYIDGEEYTIDALGDLNGNPVAISPRIRLKINGGLAVQSITVSNKILNDYTSRIIKKLKIIGPVNIQCKMKDSKPYFIEINTRFPSGGLPLTVTAGFNIPLLIIKMLLGEKLPKIKIKENLLMIRYWDALFVGKKGESLEFQEFYHEF